MADSHADIDNFVEQVCSWLDEPEGCVLFPGAAFSKRDPDSDAFPGARGAPSTEDLLKAFGGRAPGDTLSKVLQRRCQECAPGWLTQRLLDEFHYNPTSKETDLNTKDTHHLAAQLPFHLVITTNVDDLLEKAYDRMWKDVASIILDGDLPLLTNADVALVKPHGCVRFAGRRRSDEHSDSTFVFTDSQYGNFRNNRPSLSRWLTAILATHRVLYVGYGIRDDNFLSILFDGVGMNPIREGGSSPFPGSYAIVGRGSDTGNLRYLEQMRVKALAFDAGEFMRRLVEKYDERRRSRAANTVDILRQHLADAPKRFTRNCQIAAVLNPFPSDLLRWKPEDVKDGGPSPQALFQTFLQGGILEPVLELGSTWFQFRSEVRTFLLKTMGDAHSRRAYFDEYLDFLRQHSNAS